MASTDDDEELCPVCESTCTCNHVPKDRGSARANGYRPKALTSSAHSTGKNIYVTQIRTPTHDSLSSASSSEAESPTQSPTITPLKIRLVLGPKKPSTKHGSPERSPSPTLDDSATNRRKRPIEHTSSSDSSSSSSALDHRSRPIVASGYRRQHSQSLIPSHRPSPAASLQSWNAEANGRARPQNYVSSGRHIAEESAGSSSRDIEHGHRSTGWTSSASRPPSSTAMTRPLPASSSGAGPSKPPSARAGSAGTPPSAWFLGAPPSKPSHLKASATRRPAGFTETNRGPNATPTRPKPSITKIAARVEPKVPRLPGPVAPKSSIAKAHATKPPLGKKESKSRSSPKKKRRLNYTHSHDRASSLSDDASEDEYQDRSLASRAQARKNTSAMRGRGGHSSGGITIGRPVGLILPTFASKNFSSSSSSSAGSGSESGTHDENELDQENDSDEDIVKEEEKAILKEERQREKRRRRERYGGRKAPRVDADIFMGSDLTSLSASDRSDSSSSSSSASEDGNVTEDDDDSEEDEDEADDLEPPQPLANDWSESEEDDTDADLFFANFLSDEEEENENEDLTRNAQAAVVGEHDNPMLEAGFGINEGDVFVDADTWEAMQRRKGFRSHRGRGARTHPYRRVTNRKQPDKYEQALIITEDQDGRLNFGDGWRVGDSIVNSEWEKAQMAVMMNDEEVTSEESEPEADKDVMLEANAVDEVDEGTSTETDYDGESTVDEGLDEDGLPPAMAAQSQQHRSEREFNRRRLRGDNHIPLPSNLPPGVELFEGGYATVLFGRHDFPSIQPTDPASTLMPLPSDPASDYPEWEGIKDDDEDEEDSEPVQTPATSTSIIPIKQELMLVDTVAPAALTDLTAGTPMQEIQKPLLPSAEILTAKPFLGAPIVESPTAEDGAPVRKLPSMGAFHRSPPPDSIKSTSTTSRTTTTTTISTPSQSRSTTTSTMESSSSIFASSITPRSVKPMAILDGKSSFSVPSPFANVKRRKKPSVAVIDESDGSVSFGHRSDWTPGWGLNAQGRARRPSTSHSTKSSFSQPSFSQPFSPITGQGPFHTETRVKPEPSMSELLGSTFFGQPACPPTPMDLTDVLDASFLTEDEGAAFTTADEGGEGLHRNLSRWDRVPIGTFRHSRAFGTAGAKSENEDPTDTPHRLAGNSDGFSYGAIVRPSGAGLGTALWSDIVQDVKGKGKAKARVASPMLIGGKEHYDEDMTLLTGVAEEEGYFSHKNHKGGREGTERTRLKRKLEEKDLRRSAPSTLRPSPISKRVRAGHHAEPQPQNTKPMTN